MIESSRIKSFAMKRVEALQFQHPRVVHDFGDEQETNALDLASIGLKVQSLGASCRRDKFFGLTIHPAHRIINAAPVRVPSDFRRQRREKELGPANTFELRLIPFLCRPQASLKRRVTSSPSAPCVSIQ